MICSLMIQTYVLVRLRTTLSLQRQPALPRRRAPAELSRHSAFDRLDPHVFRQGFGAFLMVYALSTVVRPKPPLLTVKARPVGHAAVGFAGGLVGGLTAMPGAVLAIWCDAHAMPKIAAARRRPAIHRRDAEPGAGVPVLKAPGAPAAVLPHLPFVLPALFAG